MEEAQLQVVRMACCKSRMNPVIRMDESPDEDAGAGRANKPTQIWLSGPAFAVSPQDNRFGFAGVSKNSLVSSNIGP